MTIALTSDALTTLANARVFLRRSGVSDATEDDLISLLINSYSRAIRIYLDRQLKPTETAATKKFRYDGRGILSLAPYELSAVTSITLHTDLPTTSQDTLDAGSSTVESEYRLEPRNGTAEGTYQWVVLPELDLAPARLREEAQVSIVGNWGAGSVPADVELACLIAVANGFRNPEGFASRGVGGYTFAEPAEAETPQLSLPRDARALLAPYRRPPIR